MGIVDKMLRAKRIVKEKEKVQADINILNYLLSQEDRESFIFTSQLDGERRLNLTREDLERILQTREITFNALEQEFLSL